MHASVSVSVAHRAIPVTADDTVTGDVLVWRNSPSVTCSVKDHVYLPVACSTGPAGCRAGRYLEAVCTLVYGALSLGLHHRPRNRHIK